MTTMAKAPDTTAAKEPTVAKGTTFKTCACKDPATGKRLGKNCPKLRRPHDDGGARWNTTHGSWGYQLELPTHTDGKRRNPLRRSGFATLEDAGAELDHARGLLTLDNDPAVRRQITKLMLSVLKDTKSLPNTEEVRRKVRTRQDLNRHITVAEWLEEFLKRKRAIEATTKRSYESHVRLYLNAYLGDIRLDRLRVSDIASMFDAIEEFNDIIATERASGDPTRMAAVKYRRPVGPTSMHRIRATLRHALNIAIRQDRLLDFNPAAVVEMTPIDRPKPVIWTEEKVTQWRKDHAEHRDRLKRARDGKRVDPIATFISTPRPSPVMVWTTEQTSAFLTYARRDRLFALYRLIAVRGLRRGEGAGLRWPDIIFATSRIGIHWQITQLGWTPIQGSPKTDASDREIAIDAETMTLLKEHRKRQARQRLAAGEDWVDSDFVFTDELGRPLHPQQVTDRFYWLCYQAGLPPIRLHDLRHGAATAMLAAGVDIKIVQETLGHTSSSFTRDTYTSVYPEAAAAAAEATAALLSASSPVPPRHDTTRPRAGGQTATTETDGAVIHLPTS
ncbi:site-specific integrase [Nonomuraea sp. KC401]|uniref:tyrosine-type recombinase/integrase n=1 Tax=unclassified Nonomuraea TaxID=2593643 RepID=UPI0010FF0BD4|nr:MULTISPECIES: site-specific integrase [unclassified Nonomuraea]NBF00553.1 tyrosine-type recombinase/integrase [Nonomuraea sp. K271]TLF46120.1 site-specific integrase [Nonomuraea sp. KC401]